MNAFTTFKKLLFFIFTALSVSVSAQKSVRKIVTSRQEIFELGQKIDSNHYHLTTGMIFWDKDSIKRFFVNQRELRLKQPKRNDPQYFETPQRIFAELLAMAKEFGVEKIIAEDTPEKTYAELIQLAKLYDMPEMIPYNTSYLYQGEAETIEHLKKIVILKI